MRSELAPVPDGERHVRSAHPSLYERTALLPPAVSEVGRAGRLTPAQELRAGTDGGR
jgi:hypothetical protein